jgi:multiple sugar transport system substrate-binding protein
MQWRHFVPAYDPWFNETFARQWGEANDVDVIVDNVGFADLTPRAAAEIQAQRGHDLIQFVTPHAMLVDHLLDHREIFEECSRRYGKPMEFALRAHFNPKTRPTPVSPPLTSRRSSPTEVTCGPRLKQLPTPGTTC